ncbi:MAG: SCP2 sterol-binding domain-containing protein [Rhodocyclaceae bacterium]
MLEQAAVLVLNHLLQDAQWARERLARSAGATARLALPGLLLEFTINADGTVTQTSASECDVVVTLPPEAILAAGTDFAAAMRKARITGSAELADTLAFVFRNLRWDAEEELSRIVGDIPARRLADIGRRFAVWQKGSALRLTENVVEFLQDEQPLLVSNVAVAGFCEAVDNLRDDLARLEKRIQRTEQGFSSGPITN